MIGIHAITESLGGSSVPCYVPAGAPPDLMLICVVIAAAVDYDNHIPSLVWNPTRNGDQLDSQIPPYYREITGIQHTGEPYIGFRYQVRIFRQPSPDVGNYPITIGLSTSGDAVLRRSIRAYLLTRATYHTVGGTSGTSGTSDSRNFGPLGYWGAMQIGGAAAVGDIAYGQPFDTVNVSASSLDNSSWFSNATYGSYYRIAANVDNAILGTRVSWSPATWYANAVINLNAEDLLIPLNSEG